MPKARVFVCAAMRDRCRHGQRRAVGTVTERAYPLAFIAAGGAGKSDATVAEVRAGSGAVSFKAYAPS